MWMILRKIRMGGLMSGLDGLGYACVLINGSFQFHRYPLVKATASGAMYIPRSYSNDMKTRSDGSTRCYRSCAGLSSSSRFFPSSTS